MSGVSLVFPHVSQLTSHLKGALTVLRVAIIGAGISGLACAHELGRHGITPDIFEQRPRCGELFTHCAVLLQIMHRPIKDQIKYLYENLHITIKPLNRLKKITMYAPKASGSVYGNLGFLVNMGQRKESIANQLLGQVKTPIRYNVRADYSRLSREYDYVIVATGSHDVAKILGCWENVNTSWVMGATVLGSFDPNAMMMWLNTEYARNGYAYLTPFNHKSASLALIVTDINRKEIGDYWKKFWQIEKLTYKVAALWDLQHVSGFVYPHQVGNVLFVGNAGGMLEPFLGFAQIKSMQSGVYAARSIAEGKSYEEYLEQIKENIRVTIALRRQLDRYKNENFDHLVALLTTPGIKQLVYNTDLDFLKYTASAVSVIEKVRSLTARKIETGNSDKV